jgi:hypothetical protein
VTSLANAMKRRDESNRAEVQPRRVADWIILAKIDESVSIFSYCVFGLRCCLPGFRSGRRGAVSGALREVPRLSNGSNARRLGSACHE